MSTRSRLLLLGVAQLVVGLNLSVGILFTVFLVGGPITLFQALFLAGTVMNLTGGGIVAYWILSRLVRGRKS